MLHLCNVCDGPEVFDDGEVAFCPWCPGPWMKEIIEAVENVETKSEGRPESVEDYGVCRQMPGDEGDLG